MANKPSSIKRVRQNERRRTRNRAARSEMRTAVKSANVAIVEKNVESVDTVVKLAQSKLAKAAKRNLIKKNKASRLQSRMMKKVDALKKAAAAA